MNELYKFERIWLFSIIFWAVGILAWVMTYILIPANNKKNNGSTSGIPGIPFLLFLAAGLLSPYHYLALLCFSDISILMLAYEIISECFRNLHKKDK